MEIVNHTAFPAQAFEAVDQHGQRFDVFVLRQTLGFSSGRLEYADMQAPLCMAGQSFDDADGGSTRQESDSCPYKPRCDVIVNARAYAPRGIATHAFPVRVRVTRGGAPSPAFAIDKTLTVHGEHYFRKKLGLARCLQWRGRCGTLTLVRPNPWRLTRGAPFTGMALRDRLSYGRQCRIEASDRDARGVPHQYRLTPEQMADHPDRRTGAPIAHMADETNPAGTGFAPAWYLKAKRISAMAAPRIERLGNGIAAARFWNMQQRPDLPPGMFTAGFGIRSRLHPARRALLGTVNHDFIQSGLPLPPDFDFGMWNAAQADQQIDFPESNETIELVNLCRPDAPGAAINAGRHTVLSLTLPGHRCFMLMRTADGLSSTLQLQIDTILLEPEQRSLTLV